MAATAHVPFQQRCIHAWLRLPMFSSNSGVFMHGCDCPGSLPTAVYARMAATAQVLFQQRSMHACMAVWATWGPPNSPSALTR